MARAPASRAGGHRFESCTAHHPGRYPFRRGPYRRPRVPPVDAAARALHRRLPVTDLHAHPLFHLTYWGNDVGRRQRPPSSWNPFGACQWDLPRAREGVPAGPT